MNRDYRGKIKENQLGNELDWVYGDLVRELKTGRTFILDLSHFDNSTTLESVLIEVIPETVGQHTGLKDKNGKKAYEGDILERVLRGEKRVLVCSWDDDNYCFKFKDIKYPHTYHCSLEYDTVVIGNIHDNPELLEE